MKLFLIICYIAISMASPQPPDIKVSNNSNIEYNDNNCVEPYPIPSDGKTLINWWDDSIIAKIDGSVSCCFHSKTSITCCQGYEKESTITPSYTILCDNKLKIVYSGSGCDIPDISFCGNKKNILSQNNENENEDKDEKVNHYTLLIIICFVCGAILFGYLIWHIWYYNYRENNLDNIV